jgi:O-antigen/teichoic acid export membrane protein
MSRGHRPSALEGNPASRWLGLRGRRILLTGAWSMVAKVAAAANLFLSIPFVLHALGPSQFGVWATLVSFVTFAGFLDFGFGNGTMNLVATAHGSGKSEEIGNIMYEGIHTLLLVALALACVALVIIPLAPWYRLLGMPEASNSQYRMAIAGVLFTIVMAVPLNLSNRVLLGLGQGDRAFRWQAVGQLCTLAAVATLSKISPTLPTLTTAAVATPLLASVANTVTLWRSPIVRASRPFRREKAIASHIRREGALFFVLQLAAALAYSSDLPMISAIRGPIQAGTYAIVQRFFSVIPLGLSLIWAPLWPIYRQALAAGDHKWATRTLRQSLLFAVLFASSTALVLAFGFDHVIGFWVHRPIEVGGMLLAGFVVSCTIDSAGTAFATFLNAASIMRYQIVVASVFAVICFVMKAWAISRLGIVSVPWTIAAIYSLVSLLPTLILAPRLIETALKKAY